MSSDEARARRAKAWTRVYRPGDQVDMELEDARYWLRLHATPGARILEAWRLSEEVWLWAGRGNAEPRLPRLTERIQRG